MKTDEPIVIRRARSEDYQEVCDLFRELDELHVNLCPERFQKFEDPIRPVDLFEEKVVSSEKALFIASDGPRLVGFVDVQREASTAFPLFKPREFASIHNLFVREEYRGTGLAHVLFDRAKQWARDNGFNSLELTVYRANQGAMKFYEKAGMVPLKTTFEMDI